MPTTPDSLKGLVAISEDSKVKPLGYVTWFSVPDEAIGLRKLKTTLAMNGLPPTLAPKDTKAINTFKRAMRVQEGRKRENGLIRENAVAQVTETADECVYQVSTLVRDLDEQVIDYAKAMRVVFDKATEEINFKPLGGASRSEVLGVIEAIQEFYDKNSSKVTGARVRGIVRNYLKNEPDEQRDMEGLSGENLRGKAGGVYFILAQHSLELKAMSQVLEELYPGRAYLHAVPMADSATEREIIRRHHVANTKQEMQAVIAEVRDLLRNDRERAPRSDVIANKWAQYRALERRSKKYQEALADEQEEINDMAAVLHRQLDKLVG